MDNFWIRSLTTRTNLGFAHPTATAKSQSVPATMQSQKGTTQKTRHLMAVNMEQAIRSSTLIFLHHRDTLYTRPSRRRQNKPLSSQSFLSFPPTNLLVPSKFCAQKLMSNQSRLQLPDC